MMTKKKILNGILLVGIAAFTCVGVNFAVEKQNNKFDVLLNNIDAYASGENEPGHYTGAKNVYCKEPKGKNGCADDTNPTRVCTYSIFCTKY